MVSRTRRFIAGLVSGYALIVANIAYTALSIPLALQYLGKEGFGLWAIALQVVGYFMLIDVGVSSAVSRLLANHKDSVNGGDYGSLLLTGALTFSVQGLILAIGGAVLALFAPGFFHVPPHLAAEFRNILLILSVVGGLNIATRAITAPLWAFQRMDLVYGFGIITQLGSLTFLYLGFHAGWGIYSLAYAGIPPLVICTLVGLVFCQRHGFYPSSGCWGKPRWAIFHKTFFFAKDVMLMAVGSQLVNASQIVIIGRFVGLEAAAVYAVGTKFFMLGSQLTGRLLESASPALTEMFVQNDRDRLLRRFSDIFRSSLLLAAIGGMALALMNSSLVQWWTSGQIYWKPQWDILLGLLLLVTTSSRCFMGLFGVTANLRPVRSIYLIEAVVFVGLGIPAATRYGISGLLITSLVAHLLVTAFFSAWSARRIIGPLHSLRRPIFSATLIFVIASSLSFFLPDAFSLPGVIAALVVTLSLSALAGATILHGESNRQLLSKMLGVISGPAR